MRKSKHTPGPWGFQHTGKRFRIDDAEGCAIASIENVSAGAEEILLEPNARLIAAAPEMLEALEVALETLLEQPELVGDADLSLKTIRSAIAKARGET